MAKFASALLLLLAAFLYVEAIVIELPKENQRGKLISSGRPRRVTPNDPRCRGRNGIFPHPQNCKAYYACKDGTSQDRQCPGGMTFHSLKHCTFDRNEECGSHGERSPVFKKDRVQCAEDYGIFVHPRDCRKYVVCVDGVPSVRSCPEKQWFQERVGCIEARRCPQEKSENIPCRKPNGLYPDHSDCKKYIKCTNWVPERKECPFGKAFDAFRKICKPESEVRCKKNSLTEITESN